MAGGFGSEKYSTSNLDIKDVSFESSVSSANAIRLVISDGHIGTQLENISITGCRFNLKEGKGIEIKNESARPKDKDANLSKIVIAENLFYSTEKNTGIGIHLNSKLHPSKVVVANNTFHGLKQGFHFEAVPQGENGGIMLTRNLFNDVNEEIFTKGDKKQYNQKLVSGNKKFFNLSVRKQGEPKSPSPSLFEKPNSPPALLSDDPTSTDFLKFKDLPDKPKEVVEHAKPYIGAVAP